MADRGTVIVCIDPGHYKSYNRCPGNPAYSEAEVMWDLHLLQKKYLEQLGVTVRTTRTDPNKDLALHTRGTSSKGCALFISNHTNAVGSAMNESVDYVAVYHLTNDTTVACDDISKEFARKIAPVIATVMGTKQECKVLTRNSSNDKNGDGMLNDNYYGVLNGARSVEVPGVILEHSFHTNSKVVTWLLNSNNLDKLARAEAECIASFVFGKEVSLNDTAPAPGTNENVLYRVQVGAFGIKANAVAQLKAVEAKGFDAILVEIDNLYKVQVGAFSVKTNAETMLKRMKDAGFDAFITTKSGKTVNTSGTAQLKPITEVAQEVIAGRWGNGAARKTNLTAAGYDYTAVNNEVNRILAERADGTANVHVVKPGDTLSELAVKYKTTVSSLIEKNKAKYPKISKSHIVVGWKLRV